MHRIANCAVFERFGEDFHASSPPRENRRHPSPPTIEFIHELFGNLCQERERTISPKVYSNRPSNSATAFCTSIFARSVSMASSTLRGVILQRMIISNCRSSYEVQSISMSCIEGYNIPPRQLSTYIRHQQATTREALSEEWSITMFCS